jgi:hypothetical protein
VAFSNTDVQQLFGHEDMTAAVREAYKWLQLVATKKITECVANSGHSMPNFQDAATNIAADLTTFCKLQQMIDEVPELSRLAAQVRKAATER